MRTQTPRAREKNGESAKGSSRVDAIGAAAVQTAREALEEFVGAQVGAHLGVRSETERVVSHRFAAHEPGYKGWHWFVTVMRAPRAKTVTIGEIALLPGDEALLAQEWLPWNERLRPGDVGVGDLLPAPPDDDRLVPSYVLSDDPAVAEVAYELGLGRPRVMSRTGRDQAAERWYESDAGPAAAGARAAPGRCGTCGFYAALAGSLGALFGACANAFSPDDGEVVSADHGCGAHSETLTDTPPTEPQPV